MREFILRNKRMKRPFEEIEKTYYDCTPEYVGVKMYEIICKAVETRNNENVADSTAFGDTRISQSWSENG